MTFDLPFFLKACCSQQRESAAKVISSLPGIIKSEKDLGRHCSQALSGKRSNMAVIDEPIKWQDVTSVERQEHGYLRE